MKINVYGMGYVGCVSAACLAQQGHQVRGVDVQRQKVDAIMASHFPIVEPGLEALIREVVSSGRLDADTEGNPDADLSVVCVGTPSNRNGALCLEQILAVSEQIGTQLRQRPLPYHVVCVRSTVLPGTVRGQIIPQLEKASGMSVGTGFGICMNPEFLREGSSIEDFMNPPFTIIGQFDVQSGERVAELFQRLEAPIYRVSIETAEMMKYACNAFHALKVGFANEVGRLCKAVQVDGVQVMDLVCRDTKLNISPKYLRPGTAFGGSCLPKDVRALNHFAREVYVNTPILHSILASNEGHLKHLSSLIDQSGKRRIGMLGLSFKANTDDLRESPFVSLAEYLLGKGYEVVIHDAEVELAKLFGTNKKYVEKSIPHVASLMSSSVSDVVERADLLVLGKCTKEITSELSRNGAGKVVIDLVHMPELAEQGEAVFEGICW